MRNASYFNNNKNTIFKRKHKKTLKNRKKTCFLNFNKKHKKHFYIYGLGLTAGLLLKKGKRSRYLL